MSYYKFLSAIICLLVMFSTTAADQPGDEKLPSPEEQAKIIQKLSNSFVKVLMEVKADKGQTPDLSGWSELCPNCGSYHSVESGNTLLDEERPVETAGYLIAPDKVITRDIMVHPRFVKSLKVEFKENSVSAEISDYAVNANALLLKLKEPLPETTPLEFTPVTEESKWLIVSYAKLNGRWAAGIKPLSGAVMLTEKGKSFRASGGNGVVVTADGTAVGVIMSDKTPLDYSWSGSVQAWKWIRAEEYKTLIEKLRTIADNSLLRTKLNFRSPKKSSNERYYYMDDPDMDESRTEMDAIAVLADRSRVIVLANLKPKTTARLKKITLFTSEGREIDASFNSTLNDYGAFLADLEEPLENIIQFAPEQITEYLDNLLLCADIRVQGEEKIMYLTHTRIPGVEPGWRNQLYPEVMSDWNDSAGQGVMFVFDTNARLISMPVPRRIKVQDESRWYSRERLSTPIRYIQSALADLSNNIDKSNIPLSEEEENRLAWMGVELQPLNKELARINKVSDLTGNGRTGALISYVYPDSPAGQAQIEPGMVLLRLYVEDRVKPIDIDISDSYSYYMDDFPWDQFDMIPAEYFEDVPSPWPGVDNMLNKTLTNLGFGKKFIAEFAKNGEVFKKDFIVVDSPKHFDSAEKYKSTELGMTVRDMTYEVRRYFQKNEQEPGIIVSKIEQGEKAAVAGIKPYEIITHVNDKPVTNVKEFEEMITSQQQLKLSIVRKLKGRVVNIKMDQPNKALDEDE